MNSDLSCHPRLLALLEEARLAPDDDAPRLVLADWLDDHGDGARAEFLRLQCLSPRLAVAQERCRALLDRHGGAWLGPLWRWPARRLDWHRGLLTLRPPALGDHAAVTPVLPWVDTVLLAVCCRDGLRDAAGLLAASGVNHAGLDLRQPFRESALLAELSRLPASACLRTLSFELPYRLQRPGGANDAGRPCRRPSFGDGFLRRLLGELPLGQRLTHLGCHPAWSPEQAALIRAHGVEPAHAGHELWTQDLPPAAVKARGQAQASACVD
jgi:uncharacterized protein (TIGR02996 family)